MSNDKFKVGQKWKTRGGDTVKVVAIFAEDDFPVRGDDCMYRTMTGYWLGDHTPHSDDLVELVQDVDAPVITIEGDVTVSGSVDIKPAERWDQTPDVPAPNIPCTANSELRQEFIGKVIVAGATNNMPASDIREYINLYDSALG